MAGEHEWARRIKAAAAYAGLERQELAKRLQMSDSTLRRHLAADKRPYEVRALCQTVAEITGLPYAFFTVDFTQLDAVAAGADFVLRGPGGEVQAVIETKEHASQFAVIVSRLDALEEEIGLRDSTRRTGQALGAALDAADAAETEAAASTRDASGASPEEAQARAPEKRRSGGRSAG